MADMDYNSSEELQRHNADVFAVRAATKEEQEQKTQNDKFKTILDKYIAEHGASKKIRDMAKANGRTADYQLDLSADLVEILEKIKNEVR